MASCCTLKSFNGMEPNAYCDIGPGRLLRNEIQSFHAGKAKSKCFLNLGNIFMPAGFVLNHSWKNGLY